MKKILSIIIFVLLVGRLSAQQYGIINNLQSPEVQFKSIDLGDCRWTDGFWADKWKVCEETMVPHMGEILKGDIGFALDNFKIAAGLKEGKHRGMFWHDGDFYKWMEAATYIYAIDKDPKILQDLDATIDIIAKAQQPDGYLQTQIQLDPKKQPFSNRRFHEMYNSGHLYTSACIYYRVTGKRKFLDVAIKHADNLYKYFHAPTPDSLGRFGFNQTQIMGLVELYRTTHDKKYLDLAETFIDNRGKYGVDGNDPTVRPFMVGDMVQERVPLRKETTAVGHAVLSLYYYAGAADVFAETADSTLIHALDKIWSDYVNKKMYVTGAVGQTHHGLSKRQDKVHEAFLPAYDMPNITAYNETCANIANAMFSYRMLGIHGEAKYADVAELVLYNSALSGISLDGTQYFYANPLRKIHNFLDYRSTESACREPYIDCFCCPPNLVRTIAKLSGWAYSKVQDGIAVNLYGGNKLKTSMLDGSALEVHQQTRYPWDGAISLTIDKCKKAPFALYLRIPQWATGAVVHINGKSVEEKPQAGTYLRLERSWQKGDFITLTLPMSVERLEGNPMIEQLRNQIAIKRGPVVYCIESPDLPENTSIQDVYLPVSADMVAEYKSDFLGGVEIVKTAIKMRTDKNSGMYHPVSPKWKTVSTQLIPYFAWSNRGESEMTVWLPAIW